MLNGMAANSILAKVRAKYGHALTAQNYQDMAGLSQVSEVAAYLKNRTAYRRLLAGARESVIHRGNLEQILEAGFYDNTRQICHFERNVGDPFFACFLIEEELTKLEQFLRFWMAGRAEDFLPLCSLRRAQHICVDLPRLLLAEDYRDILDAVTAPALRRMMEQYEPQKGERLDLALVESALTRYRYAFEFGLVEHRYSGETRQRLTEMLSVEAELDDISRILRSKAYFRCPDDELRGQLTAHRAYLSAAQLEQLITAGSYEEAVGVLQRTKYRRTLDRLTVSNIDGFKKQHLYELCRRRIRMTTSPAVAMQCYITLTRNEISNIITCIEGVRYAMPPEAILELLIR